MKTNKLHRVDQCLIPLLFFCTFFVMKKSAAYIEVHFRLDFFLDANNMNPDRTAPKGPYCLQYRLPENRLCKDWVNTE